MIDALILGIKDVIRNKRTFLAFLTSIVAISLMTISSIMPLIREFILHDHSNSNFLYSVVPISNDMSSNRTLLKELNEFLNEDGSSFFEANMISVEMKQPVVVVLDALMNKTMPKLDGKHPRTDARMYVKHDYSKIEDNLNLYFPDLNIIGSVDIKMIDQRVFDIFHEDQVVVLFLKTSELEQWVDLEYGLEIISLAEFISFKNTDNPDESMESFESLFSDSFLNLRRNSARNIEATFLVSFVYPMLFIALVVIVVGFAIMVSNLFKRMYREYTIHLISGATYMHIFIRHSVFTFLLGFLCLMIISVLNRFKVNSEFWIILSFLTTVVLIFEVVLLIIVSRKSILKNVKGDV